MRICAQCSGPQGHPIFNTDREFALHSHTAHGEPLIEMVVKPPTPSSPSGVAIEDIEHLLHDVANTLHDQTRALFDRVAAAEKRIAELESRSAADLESRIAALEAKPVYTNTKTGAEVPPVPLL